MQSKPAGACTHQVVYRPQYASPNLTDVFAKGVRRADTDPRWNTTGAASADQYAFWARRLAPMACVQMAAIYWGGAGAAIIGHPHQVPGTVELARSAYSHGVYFRHADDAPALVRGPVWSQFSPWLLSRLNLAADLSLAASAERLTERLRLGNLAMLSVHPSLRTGHAPPSSAELKGHTVLAVGYTPEALLVHDPGAADERRQRNVRIPWGRLHLWYQGRALFVSGLASPR